MEGDRNNNVLAVTPPKVRRRLPHQSDRAPYLPGPTWLAGMMYALIHIAVGDPAPICVSILQKKIPSMVEFLECVDGRRHLKEAVTAFCLKQVRLLCWPGRDDLFEWKCFRRMRPRKKMSVIHYGLVRYVLDYLFYLAEGHVHDRLHYIALVVGTTVSRKILPGPGYVFFEEYMDWKIKVAAEKGLVDPTYLHQSRAFIMEPNGVAEWKLDKMEKEINRNVKPLVPVVFSFEQGRDACVYETLVPQRLLNYSGRYYDSSSDSEDSSNRHMIRPRSWYFKNESPTICGEYIDRTRSKSNWEVFYPQMYYDPTDKSLSCKWPPSTHAFPCTKVYIKQIEVDIYDLKSGNVPPELLLTYHDILEDCDYPTLRVLAQEGASKADRLIAELDRIIPVPDWKNEIPRARGWCGYFMINGRLYKRKKRAHDFSGFVLEGEQVRSVCEHLIPDSTRLWIVWGYNYCVLEQLGRDEFCVCGVFDLASKHCLFCRWVKTMCLHFGITRSQCQFCIDRWNINADPGMQLVSESQAYETAFPGSEIPDLMKFPIPPVMEAWIRRYQNRDKEIIGEINSWASCNHAYNFVIDDDISRTRDVVPSTPRRSRKRNLG